MFVINLYYSFVH